MTNQFQRGLDPKDAMSIGESGKIRECLKGKGDADFSILPSTGKGYIVTIKRGNIVLESRTICEGILAKIEFKEKGGSYTILDELPTEEIYKRIKNCLDNILNTKESGPLDIDNVKKSRKTILDLPPEASNPQKIKLIKSIESGDLEYTSKVKDDHGVKIEEYAGELRKRLK